MRSWRTHRPFGILLIAYLLVRLATAWYIDAYVLLAQDYNAITIPRLAEQHDLPAIDDMEAGRLRDVLAYSSLYFLAALGLDEMGVSPYVVLLLHHVLAPAALAAAVYAAAWVLFSSTEIAVIAALLLSLVDYAWFHANVGYPILFNQALYYGDVNHVFAATMLAALLARRFRLAAASAITLSLMNATYGLNGFLCLAAVWGVARARGRCEPMLARAVAVSAVGVVAGYGLPLLATWLAPAGDAAPAAARDAAIRTYGHLAIHTFSPKYYVAGLGALLAVLAGAALIERTAARSLGERRPWFEVVAYAMLGIVLAQGVAAYWVLFVAWPVGLVAASPSKILMCAAFYACAYVAYGLVRAARAASPWGAMVTAVVLAIIAARQSVGGVWLTSAVVTLGVAILARHAPRPENRITAAGWILTAVLAADLGASMARPFADGAIRLATELKDVELRMRTAVPVDAVLVPFRIGNADTRFGPFTGLSLRTFSRRGYLPYWSVGRNAYFDSMQRHLAEERAYSAAGVALWPDVLKTLEDGRTVRPFDYYMGVRIRTAPCCALAIDVPMPTRVLADKRLALERFVAEATPREFAAYAARIGGTHLFISRGQASPAPWGPVLVESRHFMVIPIPPELRAAAITPAAPLVGWLR